MEKSNLQETFKNFMATKYSEESEGKPKKRKKTYWEKLESEKAALGIVSTEDSSNKEPGDIDKYFEKQIANELNKENNYQPIEIKEYQNSPCFK